MYDSELVKIRKKKKIARIVSAVSAVGITAMCILAFLGRKVGTFTVNLKNDGVSLSLDTKSAFQNPTSYLHVSNVKKFSGEQSYPWFKEPGSKFPLDHIHNEDYTWEIGLDTNVDGIRFFKYTFYVKNTGALNAGYDFDVHLYENVKPNNSYPLDEYLRVMVFEGEGNYDGTIYAKRSLTAYTAGEQRKEYVAGSDPEKTSTYFGFAEYFYREDVLVHMENKILNSGDMQMYTILFWLEGEDNECKIVPDNASLKIGVTINGYPRKV